MHYVYIIQSQISSNRHYIGSTKNLDNRLKQHNAGEGVNTGLFFPDFTGLRFPLFHVN
jgi:predicted GIY-YIG superfamily endonuclease